MATATDTPKTDDDTPKDDTPKDDAEDQGNPDGDTSSDDGGDDSDELGPKGKAAIRAAREERNAARKEAREYKALGMSPAEIKKILDAKAGNDDAPDPDKIREEARAEARMEALKERVEDKIEVAAAKQFANAGNAVAILLRSHDAESFLNGDKIDTEAIQEALQELLDEQPHLAARSDEDPKRKKFGKADGGRRDADQPSQLTREDLKTMSPEAIVKAKADGRLRDLFAAKST